MSFLVIEALSKAFGPHVAFAGFDLVVEQGEFMALLGPSGLRRLPTVMGFASLNPSYWSNMPACPFSSSRL
jgi:ABC-type lipopolysaccharide export system ATPase subunit